MPNLESDVLLVLYRVALQKVRDTVGSHVANVLLLSNKQVGDLSLESYFQRSAVSPSLADMLEWLLDAEGFYHRMYPWDVFCMYKILRSSIDGPIFELLYAAKDTCLAEEGMQLRNTAATLCVCRMS